MPDEGSIARLEARCRELEALVAEQQRSISQESILREMSDERNASFIALAENSDDFICILSLDGEILYINRAGRRLAGIDGGNVSGFTNARDIVPAEKEGTIFHAIAETERAGSYSDEIVLRNAATGESIETQAEFFIVHNPAAAGRRCVAVAARDMRKFKRFHESIINGESAAVALLNAITESAFLMEVDGRIIAANETVAGRYGCWIDEFVGKNLFDILPDDISSARRERAVEAFNAKKPARFEDVHNGRIIDNVFYPVADSLGRVTGFAVFGRDVTEEKRALDELRQSEERFRNAVVEAPFPIILHAEDGEILMVSRVWTELTGYTLEEIPTIFKWTEKAYGGSQDVRESIHRLYYLESRINEGEFKVRTASGETLDWEFSTAPSGVMLDGRRMVVSIAADVTERNRAQRALERKNSELSIMYIVSSSLSSSLDPQFIFEQVVEAISGLDDIIVAGRGALFVEQEGALRLMSQAGYDDSFSEKHKSLRVGECYCGRAAAQGVTVIGKIEECEGRHCSLCPLKDAHGHIVVPLKSRGRTYGVMCLCTRDGAVPQPELVDLIETLGGQIGVAIENAQLFQETKNLALHDALTGLGNRRILDVFLEKHYSHSKRTGDIFAIIMADIDHFKKYNDEHGHDEGDRILAAVGRIITESVREMDIAVRFGGEEFLVLAPEAGIEEARAIAERIRLNIKEKAGVSISLGVSQYRDCFSADEIVKKADEALYAAKRNGRDRVEVADMRSST